MSFISLALSPSVSTPSVPVFSFPSRSSTSSRTITACSPNVCGFLPPLNCLGRIHALGYISDRRRSWIVRMAPEEEKMTRRSPLDFPIEWDRPKPGRRPDIFPQFSPMKTPLPPPMPADPPEEDEEEEEEKKEEEEEDPEKEDPDKPEQ